MSGFNKAALLCGALCSIAFSAHATVTAFEMGHGNSGTGTSTTDEVIPTSFSANGGVCPAGSNVYVYGLINNGRYLASVHDSAGNTTSNYTGSTTAFASSINEGRLLYAENIPNAINSGATITATFSIASTADKLASAVCVIGAASSGSLDQDGTGATGSSSTPSASVTTTSANEIIFGLGFYGVATGTVTQDANFSGFSTFTGSVSTHFYWAYRIVSSAGAYSYAPTLSASQTWGDKVASFKVSSGGSPPSIPQRSMVGVGQ